MATDWIWYEWINESKIFLAACIKSVIIIICSILVNQIAWFNLHLIANSFTSVDMMFIVW